MTRLAQRLPVAPIPKQRLVSAMGHDVVNASCHRRSSVALALRTQRMLSQERQRGFAPPIGVAPLACGSLESLARSLSLNSQRLATLVRFAEVLAIRHRLSTAGALAKRHQRHLHLRIKTPRLQGRAKNTHPKGNGQGRQNEKREPPFDDSRSNSRTRF